MSSEILPINFRSERIVRTRRNRPGRPNRNLRSVSQPKRDISSPQTPRLPLRIQKYLDIFSRKSFPISSQIEKEFSLNSR